MSPQVRMPLLNTGHRAGASTTSASDLGLYGAAPAAFAVSVAPAADLPPLGPVQSSLPAGAYAAIPEGAPVLDAQSGSTTLAPSSVWGGLGSYSIGPGALSAFSSALQPTAAPTAAVLQIASSPTPFDFALVQQHSDDLKQALADLKLSATGDGQATEIAQIVAVQQQAAEVIGSMTQLLGGTLGTAVTAAQATDALIPARLASALGETLLAIEDRQSALFDHIETTIATLRDDVVPDPSDTLDTGLAAVGAEVAATFARIDDARDDAVTALADSSAALVDQLDATVGETFDGLVAALPVVPLAASAGAALAETTASVEDALAGLTGDDPAGGIQTLTSLVSAADVFQLHDDAPAAIDLPEALGAFGTADLLAMPDDHLPGLLGAGDAALKDFGLHDLGKLPDLDLGHG